VASADATWPSFHQPPRQWNLGKRPRAVAELCSQPRQGPGSRTHGESGQCKYFQACIDYRRHVKYLYSSIIQYLVFAVRAGRELLGIPCQFTLKSARPIEVERCRTYSCVPAPADSIHTNYLHLHLRRLAAAVSAPPRVEVVSTSVRARVRGAVRPAPASL
jgi:hypothetical protein